MALATSGIVLPLHHPFGGGLKVHNPYTERDWERDEGQRRVGARPVCPDCGSSDDFGPRAHEQADGPERHYRACKACGFWQEADGSPPYRVWLATHFCVVRLLPGHVVVACPACGQTIVRAYDVDAVAHRCGKYLTPREPGFSCVNCGQFIDRSFMEPLPSLGSDGTSAA